MGQRARRIEPGDMRIDRWIDRGFVAVVAGELALLVAVIIQTLCRP